MQLVFDFDGTITQHDTIGELAQSAIQWQRHQSQLDLQPAWEDAVQEYLEDYRSYQANNSTAQQSSRTTLEDEEKFLAGLKPIEEASLTRVSRSGLFAGLNRRDTFQMGVDAVASGRVKISAGYDDIVEAALRAGVKVSVLSVNWSGSFIEGVLHGHRRVNVVANEISRDGSIKGPLLVGLSRVTTAPDKMGALRRIVGGERDVVYFGDSVTDLACLLSCRGIVLARDAGASSLLGMLSRMGVRVPHVGLARECAGGRLFWARDFREVMQSGVLDALG